MREPGEVLAQWDFASDVTKFDDASGNSNTLITPMDGTSVVWDIRRTC